VKGYSTFVCYNIDIIETNVEAVSPDADGMARAAIPASTKMMAVQEV
jgi:hypothetical protein